MFLNKFVEAALGDRVIFSPSSNGMLSGKLDEENQRAAATSYFLKNIDQCKSFIFEGRCRTIDVNDIKRTKQTVTELHLPFKNLWLETTAEDGFVTVLKQQGADCVGIAITVIVGGYLCGLLFRNRETLTYAVGWTCFKVGVPLPGTCDIDCSIYPILKEYFDKLSGGESESEIRKAREKIKVPKKYGGSVYIKTVVVVRQKLVRTTSSVLPGPVDIDWSHRWEVRGHKRKIRGFGKDSSGNVTHGWTWVTNFVKGPEDKPLIPKLRAVEAERAQ